MEKVGCSTCSSSAPEVSCSCTPTAAPAADPPTNLSSPLVLLLESLKLSISRRIFPIPPTPAVLDEHVVDVSSVPQVHVCKGAPVLILPVGLKNDISPEDERSRRLLRSFAEGLAFLRAVDATEADTFSVSVVQDFNRVAVEDGDDEAGEVGKDCRGSQ